MHKIAKNFLYRVIDSESIHEVSKIKLNNKKEWINLPFSIRDALSLFIFQFIFRKNN